METLINKGYLPSRMSKIGTELWWRYTEKRIKPFVALGLVIWIAWMWQLTNAYPLLVTPLVITL